MRKVIWFVAAVLVLLISTAFGESQPVKGEVRSPTGKLLYKTKTTGTKTEARNSTGRLLYKSKTRPDGSTEARSPTGKLLYKTK
jgi:hypothetical protein